MSYINKLTIHDRKYGRIRPSTAVMMDLIISHMTAGHVESSTGGILVYGSRGTPIRSISIDSRTIQPRDLFFAIRGPNNDGHNYVAAALANGALGAVVNQDFEIPETFPSDRILLKVENTHQALKDLATDIRHRWRGSLVAITGSMGKTTTKEFSAQVLQTEYSVYRSPGNYNNLFGLPLALFGLSPDDHIGIFEMGMSAQGEIAEMCRIARPDVGVITNVAPVHLAFFCSLEEIALAKAELAAGLSSEGALVYNCDDARVCAIAGQFAGSKTSFGLSERAHVRAEEIEIAGLEETRFKVSCAGLTRRASIPLAGAHYVMNALAAFALGHHYRLEFDQIVESLRYLSQTHMRGQILRFHEGFTVIDDSYNSSPQALMQMIETLSRIPSFGRRILAAGEMLELGGESPTFHYDCGLWAARCGVDVLVAIRGDASELARGARDAGMPEGRIHFYSEVDPATDFVAKELRAGDLLLVKGSRAVHLEKMIQTLRSYYREQAN